MKKIILMLLSFLCLTGCDKKWQVIQKETGYTIEQLDGLKELNNANENHLQFHYMNDQLTFDFIKSTGLYDVISEINYLNLHKKTITATYSYDLKTKQMNQIQNPQELIPELVAYIQIDNTLLYVENIAQSFYKLMLYDGSNKKLMNSFHSHLGKEMYVDDHHIYFDEYAGNYGIIHYELINGKFVPLDEFKFNFDQQTDYPLGRIDRFSFSPRYASYSNLNRCLVLDENQIFEDFESTENVQVFKDIFILQKINLKENKRMTTLIDRNDNSEIEIDCQEEIYSDFYLNENSVILETKSRNNPNDLQYIIFEVKEHSLHETLLPFNQKTIFMKLDERQLLACVNEDNGMNYYLITLEK